MSDCLLLVTGTKTGEMVVIERTPTQAGIRYPPGDFIVVTNDYITMAHHAAAPEGDIIEATSCSRFEAVDGFFCGGGPKQRLRPVTFDDAFGILRKLNVQMDITVQQMCFCAATGDISVRPPG